MLARTAKAVFQVQSRQSFGWLRPIAARGLTTTTTMVERRGSEDMVKAAVQKLMMEHSPQDKDRLVQDQQHNGVTTEALQKASYCLQVCITFRAQSKIEAFLSLSRTIAIST